MPTVPIQLAAQVAPPTAAHLLDTVQGRVLLALRLALRDGPLSPPERALLADHLFAIEAAAEDLAAALGTSPSPP